MAEHFVSRVSPPGFGSIGSPYGDTVDNCAVMFGHYEIVSLFDRSGATFAKRNGMGFSALAQFVSCPKEIQKCDLRVLDLLRDSGKLGDINAPCIQFGGSGAARFTLGGVVLSLVWRCRGLSQIKRNTFCRFLNNLKGGWTNK